MERSDSEKANEILVLKKPLLGMRWVLVLLCHLLYLLATMVTNSLGVTIVAMVNSTAESSNENDSLTLNEEVCRIVNESDATQTTSTSGDFNWSSSQEGLVLGAYFWGFFFGRFFGGRLAELAGQRITAGVGMTLGALFVAVSPMAASLNVYCFVAVRFLLGVSHGPTLPAVHSLIAKWAPASQLATIITTVNAGSTIGNTIGILTSGWITESFGWQWVFWSQAILTLLWIPFWFIFIRNTPEEHPYLTPYEAKILAENEYVTTKKNVPWKKIMSSPYIYVCMFALFARVWSFVMQYSAGPTFLNKKIGLDLQTASLLTGIASLLCMPFMIFYGRLSDFIITNKYVTKLTGRRLMHGIGTCGPALMYLMITFAGCNITLVIVAFEMIGVFATATASSIYVSVIDFAPNYAGTIMGILGIGNIGGSLAPMISSYLVTTKNGWDKAFYLTSTLSVLSFIIYSLVMTDKPQAWNYEDVKSSKKDSNVEVRTNRLSLSSLSEYPT